MALTAVNPQGLVHSQEGYFSCAKAVLHQRLWKIQGRASCRDLCCFPRLGLRILPYPGSLSSQLSHGWICRARTLSTGQPGHGMYLRLSGSSLIPTFIQPCFSEAQGSDVSVEVPMGILVFEGADGRPRGLQSTVVKPAALWLYLIYIREKPAVPDQVDFPAQPSVCSHPLASQGLSL